jgi:hypothetical protein
MNLIFVGVVLSLVCGCQSTNLEDSLYSFVSIGDWGAAQLGGQYTINVDNVAAQMQATAASVSAKFVINTGDNFYWCGIQ